MTGAARGPGVVSVRPGAPGGGGATAPAGGTVGGAGLGLQGIGSGGRGASLRGGGSGDGSGAGGGAVSDAKLSNKKSEKRISSRVVLQSVRADGGLSSEVVKRIVRRYVAVLRRCHEQALTRDPSIAGIVDLRLTVAVPGRVTNVVVAGTIRDKGMKDCLAAKARLFRFPAVKDGAETTVIQRVSFAAN